MRSSALALLLLTATSDALNLRGSQNEDERRLGCDPKGSQIWIDLAIAGNLDPAIWADKFYAICMQDATDDGLKSETLNDGCWSSAVIAPWLAVMSTNKDPNMQCISNTECRNYDGVCYYKYLASSCIKSDSAMQGECGTVIANPDVAGGGGASTTGAPPSTTVAPPATTSSPPATTTLPATTVAPPATTTLPATTSSLMTALPATTALPLTSATTAMVATTPLPPVITTLAAVTTTKAATPPPTPVASTPTPTSVAPLTPAPTPWYTWPTPPGGLPNCMLNITTRCMRNDGSDLDCSEPIAPNTKEAIAIYFYMTNTGTVRAEFQMFSAIFTDDRGFNYGIANSTSLGSPGMYILPGSYYSTSVVLDSVALDSQGHRTIFVQSEAVARNRDNVECKDSDYAEIKVGYS